MRNFNGYEPVRFLVEPAIRSKKYKKAIRKLYAVFLLLPFLILQSGFVNGQQKFRTDNGQVTFVSNAELEIIKAFSNKVRGIIDPSTNQFAFSVDINSFRGFNSNLQREHFMDNYMEVERYAKASFSGKIIEQLDFQKDGEYDVRAKGDLDIHGQKQTRIIKSKIIIQKGSLIVESNFNVPLDEHGIVIPKIVNQKIATETNVGLTASMSFQ